MANTITYNNLIQIFKELAQERMLMVRYFGSGFVSEMNAKSDLEYPLIWIEPTTRNNQQGQNRNRVILTTLKVIIIDRIDTSSDTNNTDEIVSNCRYILDTLIADFNNNKYYRDLGIVLTGDVSDDLYYGNDDNAFGIEADITIEIPFSMTSCNIPVLPKAGYTISVANQTTYFRVSGVTGSQGPQGALGYQGVNGVGYQGYQGVNGIGIDGVQGSQGYQGATGPGTIITGTAGYIPHYNSNGISLAPSNIFWDNTTQRLGIGITPSFKLDNNGDFRTFIDSSNFLTITGVSSSLYYRSKERGGTTSTSMNVIFDTDTRNAGAGGIKMAFNQGGVTTGRFRWDYNPGTLKIDVLGAGTSATEPQEVLTLSGNLRQLIVKSGNSNQADYDGLIVRNDRGAANDNTNIVLENNNYAAKASIKMKVINVSSSQLQFWNTISGTLTQNTTLFQSGNMAIGGLTTDDGIGILQVPNNVYITSNTQFANVVVGDRFNTLPTGNRSVTIGSSNLLSAVTNAFGNTIGYANNSTNTTGTQIMGVFNSQRSTSGGYGILIGNSNVNYNGYGSIILGSDNGLSHSYTLNGSGAVVIGSAIYIGHIRSAGIGANFQSTGNGQFIIAQQSVGGTTVDGYNDICFGTGFQRLVEARNSISDVTLNGSGGSTFSDSIAGSIVIAGGKGTGNAVAGDVYISTATRLASGTTRQSLEKRLVVKENTGYVGIGYGTASPAYLLHVNGTASFRQVRVSNVLEYSDNGTAVAAGLTAGFLYRTGEFLKIVY